MQRFATLVAWVAIYGSAHGQEAAPNAVQLPGGVEVRLKAANTGLNDVAAVLEAYAKQLRNESKIQTVGAKVPETVPAPAAESAPLSTAVLAANTAPVGIPHSEKGYQTIAFPTTLLWQPPYANHHEPHTYAKYTTLEEIGMTPVTDVAVGGTFPFYRWAAPDCPDNGWQFDLFAMISSRFIHTNYLMATDYRFGVPITFAFGRWSGKIAFEHTSTHVGDEYVDKTGQEFISSVRDEFVFGLAYRVLEPVRLYGIFGYDFSGRESFREEEGSDKFGDRYSVGAEYSRPLATGPKGQPFAAVDVEFRGSLDYTPNFTAQAGWQWLAEGARPGLRLVAEYYEGRNPFGQFHDRHENRAGVALYYDF